MKIYLVHIPGADALEKSRAFLEIQSQWGERFELGNYYPADGETVHRVKVHPEDQQNLIDVLANHGLPATLEEATIPFP